MQVQSRYRPQVWLTLRYRRTTLDAPGREEESEPRYRSVMVRRQNHRFLEDRSGLADSRVVPTHPEASTQTGVCVPLCAQVSYIK